MARDWYRLARVRAGEALSRVVGGALFAPELLPHLAHVRGAEERAELSRLALARYLHETEVLELRVVNEVAVALAHGEMPFTTSRAARLDALKIYCDEGYHAVLAADLLAQIGEPSGEPAFLCRLRKILAGHPPTDAPLVRFLFTVVSETAVSANLRVLARSAALAPAIRHFVAQHAKDEAWHAVYFREAFQSAWREIPSRFEVLLPELIDAYLAPDIVAIAADLQRVGYGAREASRIAREAEAVRDLRALAPVHACFRSVGITIGGA